MKRSMNRRMFLRGASGAVMAIPFLPSLTTKAFAQDGPQPQVGKNFLAICSDHGDVWGANQYPSDAILTQTLAYAGRDVRYGLLPTARCQWASELVRHLFSRCSTSHPTARPQIQCHEGS